MGLSSFYEILETEIRGKNGTEFSFAGLLNHTVDSVKSFEGATITWIEEAQTVSKHSLDILIPTVIRTANPMIIMSLNPRLPQDAVYADYIAKERDDTLVVQVNYTDNPHCPSEIKNLAASPPHRRLRNTPKVNPSELLASPPHRRLRNIRIFVVNQALPSPPHRRLRKQLFSLIGDILPSPPHRRLRNWRAYDK